MNDTESVLRKIYNVFTNLGFECIKINEENVFLYNDSYYKVTYVEQYNSIVIETAENYEDAKNGIMEDDDWYNLYDRELLKKIENDLIQFYM